MHEELNKESRRLLNLLLLLLECLSMSAITAEEQAAKLVRPLSAPLHILENGMLAVIAEVRIVDEYVRGWEGGNPMYLHP